MISLLGRQTAVSQSKALSAIPSLESAITPIYFRVNPAPCLLLAWRRRWSVLVPRSSLWGSRNSYPSPLICRGGRRGGGQHPELWPGGHLEMFWQIFHGGRVTQGSLKCYINFSPLFRALMVCFLRILGFLLILLAVIQYCSLYVKGGYTYIQNLSFIIPYK